MSNPRPGYARLPTEEDGDEHRSPLSTTSSIDDLVKSNRVQLFCASAGIIIGQMFCIGGALVLPNFIQDVDKTVVITAGASLIIVGVLLLFLALNVFTSGHKELARSVSSVISERFNTLSTRSPPSLISSLRRSSRRPS